MTVSTSGRVIELSAAFVAITTLKRKRDRERWIDRERKRERWIEREKERKMDRESDRDREGGRER